MRSRLRRHLLPGAARSSWWRAMALTGCGDVSPGAAATVDGDVHRAEPRRRDRPLGLQRRDVLLRDTATRSGSRRRRRTTATTCSASSSTSSSPTMAADELDLDVPPSLSEPPDNEDLDAIFAPARGRRRGRVPRLPRLVRPAAGAVLRDRQGPGRRHGASDGQAATSAGQAYVAKYADEQRHGARPEVRGLHRRAGDRRQRLVVGAVDEPAAKAGHVPPAGHAGGRSADLPDSRDLPVDPPTPTGPADGPARPGRGHGPAALARRLPVGRRADAREPRPATCWRRPTRCSRRSTREPRAPARGAGRPAAAGGLPRPDRRRGRRGPVRHRRRRCRHRRQAGPPAPARLRRRRCARRRRGPGGAGSGSRRSRRAGPRCSTASRRRCRRWPGPTRCSAGSPAPGWTWRRSRTATSSLGARLMALVVEARADGVDPEAELRAVLAALSERVRVAEAALPPPPNDPTSDCPTVVRSDRSRVSGWRVSGWHGRGRRVQQSLGA